MPPTMSPTNWDNPHTPQGSSPYIPDADTIYIQHHKQVFMIQHQGIMHSTLQYFSNKYKKYPFTGSIINTPATTHPRKMDQNTPGIKDTKELVKVDPYRYPDFTEDQYLPWITISNTGNTSYDILNVFHTPYVYHDIWNAPDFKEQLKF